MNVVDSSGWLAYSADDAHAGYFAEPIEQVEALIVPALALYEAFRRVLKQHGVNDALSAVTQMRQGKVADLDSATVLTAARLSSELKLALADSVISATACVHDAMLWTHDADFEGLNGVRFRRK